MLIKHHRTSIKSLRSHLPNQFRSSTCSLLRSPRRFRSPKPTTSTWRRCVYKCDYSLGRELAFRRVFLKISVIRLRQSIQSVKGLCWIFIVLLGKLLSCFTYLGWRIVLYLNETIVFCINIFVNSVKFWHAFRLYMRVFFFFTPTP